MVPAPKPPVPVDLEAVEKRLLTADYIGKAQSIAGPLISEIKALRSRLSEVEGAKARDIKLSAEVVENENDSRWRDVRVIMRPGIVLGYLYALTPPFAEDIAYRINYFNKLAEGTAKPSQDPKPSLTDAGVINAALELTRAWYAGKRIGDEYLAAIYSACVAHDPSVKRPQPQHHGEAK